MFPIGYKTDTIMTLSRHGNGVYSMGRYSRDGYSRAEEKEDELHDIVDQLRSMAKDLPQPTQRAIQNFTDMVG